MNISEAISESKFLGVPFSSATLNVEYRPASYTIAEMEGMLEESEKGQKAQLARIITMVQQVIIGWDLTYTEDGEEKPLDVQDTDLMREKVGIHILSAVLKAIREDNLPGEA